MKNLIDPGTYDLGAARPWRRGKSSPIFATIPGTSGGDALVGTGDADFIDAKGGDDTCSGMGGNDTIRGGAGNDTLSGNDGNDNIDGNVGHDTIDGGIGNDTIEAGDGNDVVTLSSGSDVINLGAGDDLIKVVGGGNMTLQGGAGSDTLDGRGVTSPWNVTSGGDLSIELIYLSNFNDGWTGSDLADTIYGGGGNDVLLGAGGKDQLKGEAGGDQLRGDGGNDTLDGGDGFDFVFYDTSTKAVTASLTTNRGSSDDDGTDTFIGIEALVGGSANDTLTGDTAVNALYGNGGNDDLSGGDGNDELVGEPGNDTLYGGAGSDGLDGGTGLDTASYEVDAAAINVSLLGGTGAGAAAGDSYSSIENVTGTQFNDTIRGNNFANVLQGISGNDSIRGEGGADSMTGFNGLDTLDGGTGADTMNGGAGADLFLVDNPNDVVQEDVAGDIDVVHSTAAGYTLSNNVDTLILMGAAKKGTGSAGANLIQGNTASNVLEGAGGNDTLLGGNGNDQLTGGTGQDSLEGGAGRDLFFFDDGDSSATRASADIVEDFSHGQRDKINLTAIDANIVAGGDQAFTFINKDAFSDTAGELRTQRVGSDLFIEGDVNGDGVADFSIMIQGASFILVTDIVL